MAAKGYFYRGKGMNYYYDTDDKELYAFVRFHNGHEDDESILIKDDVDMSFDEFVAFCEDYDKNQE